MPAFRSLGKFFGKTASEGAAFAAGVAIAPTLEPVVEEVRQEAWSKAHNRRLEPGAAAAIAAENPERHEWGASEALHHGFNADRFGALLEEALEAPGLAELLALWRRGEIGEAGFEHGLRKAKLEARWDEPLKALKDVRLTPAEIALGIVRSVIRDPGLLAAQLDTADSNVPRYEPLKLDPLEEAAASGFDRERLRGLIGEIGLPMSAQQAASAYFRGIITHGAYNQAILEGDTRPEWAGAILEQARQIPSVLNAVEAHVRDWISAEQMYAEAERHGMSRADTDLLFLIHGRPLSWHQVWIGLARGGQYDGPLDEIDPAFLKALRESDIRPEWYALAWAQRYTYPSAFVLRSLAQAGELTQAETDEILRFIGWEPRLAEKVSRRWSAGGSSAAKEATATDLLTLYDGRKASRAETLAALEALGYPPAEAAQKLDLVEARKVASARTAAIGDLHTAYRKGAIDATSAQHALEGLGLEPATADAITSAWAVYFAAVAEAGTQ